MCISSCGFKLNALHVKDYNHSKKKRKKCQQTEEHHGIYVTKYMDKDEE